jgi:threonine dehydrogenase-like Zn-dependent dehydrogenase
MQTVQILGSSRVEVREVPIPVPGPGEALVKIGISAICGSELPNYRGAEAAAPLHNTGHEMCGTVVQANGVCGISEGQRVGLQILYGCGQCMACLQGDPKHCQAGAKLLMNAHSDYVAAPAMCMIPLPGDLAWEQAVLVCGDTLGTPYRALKRLGGVHAGETAAVFGCGPIGLGALTWLKFYGARVIVSELGPYRRELALRLGADIVVDPSHENVVQRIWGETGDGADLCVDCSEAAQTLNDALDAARVWGRVAMVGEKATVPVHPSDQAIRKELSIAGSWYFNPPEFFEMLGYYRRGLPLSQIITHRYGLADAPEAYTRFAARQAKWCSCTKTRGGRTNGRYCVECESESGWTDGGLRGRGCGGGGPGGGPGRGDPAQ